MFSEYRFESTPCLKKINWNRGINAGIFFSCCVSLALAFYVQIYEHIEPCPLCVIQRLLLMGVALFAGIGFLLKKSYWVSINEGMILLISSLGMLVAGRHVWLQSLPSDQAPACGPSLNFMLKYMPWHKIMHALFYGSGECAKVEKLLWGVSMPQWALLIFTCLVGLSLFKFIKREQ